MDIWGRLLNVQDRVGSARGGRSFFPYGEDKTGSAPAEDSLTFATYSRDMGGLDNADQRSYASQFGRFMSPDPYMASGGVGSPASWNRYAYTRGDPVNNIDPEGLADFSVTTYLFILDGSGGGGGDSLPIAQLMPWDIVGLSKPEFAKFSSQQRRQALNLLAGASTIAIEALMDQDCLAQFLPAGGTMLRDPSTGGQLSPADVLKGLYLQATSGIDRGYGTLGFALISNPAEVGTTTGKNLQIGASGPYYPEVLMLFNVEDWNLGFSSKNTTALLHELGHVLNKLAAGVGSQNQFKEGDGWSDARSEYNTRLVQDHCTRKLKF